MRHFLIGGWLAVDVFFVLSGFLITTVLIDDAGAGFGSLRRFYLRRGGRLYPALIALVGVSVAACTVVPALRPLRGPTIGGVAGAMLYFGNLQVAMSGHEPGLIGQLWSLATEEQFYILWAPVVILLARVGARPGRVVGGLCALVALQLVADVLYAWVVPDTSGRYFHLYFSPDTHSSGLLVGCAVAVTMRALRRPSRTSRRWRCVVAGSAVAGILLLASTPATEHTVALCTVAVAVCTAVLVVACVWFPGEGVATALSTGWLRWIGRRSYGIYLWHFPVLLFVVHVVAPALGHPSIESAAVVGLSIAIAALSWVAIEAPALRLVARWMTLARPVGPPAGIAAR